MIIYSKNANDFMQKKIINFFTVSQFYIQEIYFFKCWIYILKRQLISTIFFFDYKISDLQMLLDI